MASPTAVNSQITDAVTQTNVQTLGSAPATAMGSVYQTMAHSTGILFANAISSQQQQNTLSRTANNAGLMQIYSVDTMATAAAAEKVGQLGLADHVSTMMTLKSAFSGDEVSAV